MMHQVHILDFSPTQHSNLTFEAFAKAGIRFWCTGMENTNCQSTVAVAHLGRRSPFDFGAESKLASGDIYPAAAPCTLLMAMHPTEIGGPLCRRTADRRGPGWIGAICRRRRWDETPVARWWVETAAAR
jgi:hypothetical protein